jgi:hypothetical protein
MVIQLLVVPCGLAQSFGESAVYTEIWRMSHALLFVEFLDGFTKTSPATRQLMASKNKFIAMFASDRS